MSVLTPLRLAAGLGWLGLALVLNWSDLLAAAQDLGWGLPAALLLTLLAVVVWWRRSGAAGAGRLRAAGFPRHSRLVALVTLALCCASLAMQWGLGQAAVAQLGVLADYGQRPVQLVLLEQAQVANFGGERFTAAARYTAAARLQTVGGKSIACMPALPWLSCQPRVLVSFELGQPRLDRSNGAPALDAAATNPPLSGQVIAGEAMFKPPRGGREQLSISLEGAQVLSQPGFLQQIVDAAKAAFAANLRGISADAAGLVAGLTIGEVSGVSPELRADMRTTGLTHLTAVSGANCVIVIGVVWWLLARTRLGRRGRILASLAALGFYVLLVGQQPSVLRAATMLVAVMLARLSGRYTNPVDALCAAIVFLLLCDPWLATDAGFALSALATLGLLTLTRPIESALAGWRLAGVPAPKRFRQGLAVVLAAQLLCLPIIVVLAQALPLYSLVANMLVEPLVATITVLGIAGLATGFVPGIAQLLTYLASLPAWAIAACARFFASLPAANWPWPGGPAGVLVLLVIVGCAIYLLGARHYRRSGERRRGERRYSNLAWATLAIASAWALAFGLSKPILASRWPGTNWVIAGCDVGQGDAFVVRSRGEVALIDTGRDDKAITDCLRRLGIGEIDLLVLTHFDQDHVGSVSAVLARHIPRVVLETPWPDTRPAVGLVRAAAGASGGKIIKAERGLTGRLGDFEWRVLTPSRTAEEAQDSNDGSIGLLFSSPSLQFIALADLGREGQEWLLQNNRQLLDELDPDRLVLKVAHHGSADFEPQLYEQLRARVALIGVGAGNGYGHPTSKALASLARSGSTVYRTDEDGSLAVSVGDAGELTTAISGEG